MRDLQPKVAEDVFVDHPLDAFDLLWCHRLWMGEIEAQPVRCYERTGLAGMAPEHCPQGGVQQVGGRVVAHNVVTSNGIDRGSGGIADFRFAAHDRAEVDDQTIDRLAHVCDRDLPALPVGRPDGSGIGDLPTGFDIEGGLGEHHSDGLPDPGRSNRSAISQNCEQAPMAAQTRVRIVPDAALIQAACPQQFVQQFLVAAAVLGELDSTFAPARIAA